MEFDTNKFYFINDNIIMKVINQSHKYIYGYNILQDTESMTSIRIEDIKKHFEISDSVFALLRDQKSQFILARNYTDTMIGVSKILGVHERSAIRLSHKFDIKQNYPQRKN